MTDRLAKGFDSKSHDEWLNKWDVHLEEDYLIAALECLLCGRQITLALLRATGQTQYQQIKVIRREGEDEHYSSGSKHAA